MAAAKKPRRKADPFKAFRPKTEEVAVGEGRFVIKTATLDQEARFLGIIDSLELGELIGPVTELIGNADATGTDILGFMGKLRTVGPELWTAARTVLGKQFAPAVRDASIAMLDNVDNFNSLVKAGLATEDDGEYGPDGEFLGCAITRRIIKSDLTLLQGVAVIRKTWSINGYGELLGNVLTVAAVA